MTLFPWSTPSPHLTQDGTSIPVLEADSRGDMDMATAVHKRGKTWMSEGPDLPRN